MNSGNTFEYGEFYFTILSQTTCMIGLNNSLSSNAPKVGGSFSGVLKMPEYVYDKSGKKYEVVETARFCFRDCVNLVSAFLPKTLKRINEDLFYNTGITSLTIPRSVEILDFGALSSIYKLKTLVFEPGSKLSKIGSLILYRCHEIRKIVLPLHVASIAGNVFALVSTSTKIDVFYCGVNKITDNVFSDGGDVTVYVTNKYPSGVTFGGKQPNIINDNTCKPFIDYENNNYSCKNIKYSKEINIFSVSLMFLISV